jgi:uncharacterized protein (TIGR03118 family)
MRTGTHLTWLAASIAALALGGCGGGGGGGGGGGSSTTPMPTPTPTPTQTAFLETKLVSDTAAGGGAVVDPNLVDAWGIAFGTGAPVWVNDNGTNKSTLYDGNGAIQSLVVAIPPGSASPGGTANPTGIVFNGTSGFTVTKNGTTGPASFIFVGEGGTISGWSQNVDNAHSITVVDNSASGAVYKGVGIVTGATNLLFAPNFHTGVVEVYDSKFQKASVSGGFKDPNLPAGYAPFNLQVIGTTVYVAYAQQDATAANEVDGAGLGFVDSFDLNGNLIKRLVSNGPLNAPWGMAIAPANFGTFSNDLLVGNFGDGKINVFDPNTGAFVGTISDSTGKPLVIDGLWGIAFGNGALSQPTNTLFFAAGPSSETHGLYGRIDMGAFTPVQPGTPGY